MKWIIACILACVGGCKTERISIVEKTMSKTIHIALSDQPGRFELGDALSLNIEYFNASDGPISFREPAKTWEVRLRVRRRPARAGAEPSEEANGEIEDDPQEVSFGRIIYEDIPGGPSSYSAEPADVIELDPGRKYSFQYDIGRRWLDLFPPGIHEVKIIDESVDDERVESNQISVAVTFTPDSFSRQLGVAASTEFPLDARAFARDWIRRFRPEFDLALEDPSEAAAAENRRQIDAARGWWAANAATPEVLEEIKAINRSAFPRADQ